MTHSVFRTGLAIASAALAMAVTLPADAAKKGLPSRHSGRWVGQCVR
jgi:hypothetical protein